MSPRSPSRKKGFIGPLGDDIPSLFPIVAGVVLFLATLAYASNVLGQKNSEIEVRKAAVSLAYKVTQRGELAPAELARSCDALYKPLGESLQVKFRVTVKRFCSYIDLNSPPDDPGTVLGGVSGRTTNPGAACQNTDEPPANAVTLSYPVAVPCPGAGDFRRGLGTANVIVWR